MEKHVDLVPCHSDRELFLRMAKKYVDTLAGYDKTIRWDELTWAESVWNSEFILEDRTIQGFVMTEEVRFAVYPDLLYISEFYVEPEARKRGVGMAAVKKLADRWDGDIFIYIINGNFEAKAFWGAVEQNLGWVRIERPEIRKEDGCELRVYRQGA